MGGVDFIKQMYSVFSKAKFCPTGGIDGNSYSSYRYRVCWAPRCVLNGEGKIK